MGETTFQHYLQDLEHTPRTGQRVAFFDLDGTLIAGYSIVALAAEVARQAARRGQWLKARQLIRDQLGRRETGRGNSYQRLVTKLCKTMEGFSEQTIVDLGEAAFRNNLEKRLYREAIELIEVHRSRGDDLVMVTAASHYQAAPIARTLGIKEICCTRLEVQGGQFTGEVVAPLCYGEGKLLAARRVCRRFKAPMSQCWFYTDSSADLPLMRKVGKAIAVNPSDSLTEKALAEGWPILRFKSRGKPGTEELLRTLATGQAVVSASALVSIGKRFRIPALADPTRLTRLLGDVGSAVAGLELEVDGREHLNSHGPSIYVFNHQSLLDGLVLAHLLREDAVAMCKSEMADKPFIGPLLRQVDTIFVDRQESDQSAVLAQAQDVLAAGRSLIIAPEGTRSTLGEIQPFKHGAFYLSRKCRVPIVPIVLHNVKDALPKGGLVIRPATIRVTVMPPLQPGEGRNIRQSCSTLEQRYVDLLKHSPAAALPRAAG